MPDNALDQIVDHVRSDGTTYFPQYSEVKAARVVGHTPKTDHYIYEIVLDFPEGSERVNAKIYRGKSAAGSPKDLASKELENLRYAYQTAEKRKLSGVPRPLGDFADQGAVVTTKINGLPLQSIIMKAAILPDNGNHSLLDTSARHAGEWLQRFHKATAGTATPIDGNAVLVEMEKLCHGAQKDGLPQESTAAILANAKAAFAKQKRALRSSAVLMDFMPLNVLVSEQGVAFGEFASLQEQGHSIYDAAMFLAGVEALEKYPFCDRNLTSQVQEAFVQGYEVSPQEEALLDTLKMKILLQMFVQGRVVKESAERKRVMWANVMKRFLQNAAERATARVA